MGSDRHAVGLVSAEVREQVERAMADPLRVMPRERALLEKAGFVRASEYVVSPVRGRSYATGLPFPGMKGPGVFDPREVVSGDIAPFVAWIGDQVVSARPAGRGIRA